MQRRWLKDVQRLASQALASGGIRTGPLTVTWDITGNTGCRKPHHSEFHGYPSKGSTKWIVVKRGAPAPMVVTMKTPCRKCDRCLRHRARLWTARALAETRVSSRTWFGTITLTQEAQFSALTRARRFFSRKGEDFETLPPDRQFIARHNAISPELTLWLKRVRAQAGVPFRYLLVCEAHQSGDPHYHVLIHEQSALRPVRHKVLSRQWHLGFTNFKLVTDERPAHYVAKYLSKSALARVRASLRYGTTPLAVAEEGFMYDDA